MLRQQLLRSVRLPQRLAAANARRTFAATSHRPADVELTIGASHACVPSFMNHAD